MAMHRACSALHQKSMPTKDAPGPSEADTTLHAIDDQLLENPIWHSLRTHHQQLSLGGEHARRFPASIGPLSGMPRYLPENYGSLRDLAGPHGVVVLFCPEPVVPPPGWTLLRDGLLSQMVCPLPSNQNPPELAPDIQLRELNAPDVPAMVALAELTEPGPFRQRTIELGRFFGIFAANRLLAMAGQRLHLPHHIEVSAVCTHPDVRGRGYARLLMLKVMDDIRCRGKVPFLHTYSHNSSAIRLYETLEFKPCRQLHLAVLRNDT